MPLRSALAGLMTCMLCACGTQAVAPTGSIAAAPGGYVAARIGDGPLISPETDPSIGHNIQGPSLVRVPDWVPNRLGRYYLYFADHKGAYIRLAYADRIEGPWKIHQPGALNIVDTPFPHEPPPFTDQQMADYRARKRRGSTLSSFPTSRRK